MFLKQFYQIDGAPAETIDNYDNNIDIEDVPLDCSGPAENTPREVDPIRTLTESDIKL